MFLMMGQRLFGERWNTFSIVFAENCENWKHCSDDIVKVCFVTSIYLLNTYILLFPQANVLHLLSSIGKIEFKLPLNPLMIASFADITCHEFIHIQTIICFAFLSFFLELGRIFIYCGNVISITTLWKYSDHLYRNKQNFYTFHLMKRTKQRLNTTRTASICLTC